MILNKKLNMLSYPEKYFIYLSFTILFSLSFPISLIAENNTKNTSQPSLSARCIPVEGNKPFFNNKATFNTFYGRPVPLTFFIKGDKKNLKNPAFVIYLPEDIKLKEVFQSNPNRQKDTTYQWTKTKVKLNDTTYYCYKITDGLKEQIKDFYSPSWKGAFQMTLALDAPTSFKSGKVYWALENNGEKLNKKSFILKFHKPLTVPSKKQQGKFRIMCWNPVRGLAWHSKELQKSAADLLLASGIRENLAFKGKQSRRGKFDKYLQNRGINTIYHINGFNGPSNIGHWDGSPSSLGLPGAMNPKGERSSRYAAPIPMLESKKFRKTYNSYVRKSINKQPASKEVVFDYEPWNWPTKMGFGKKAKEAFINKYKLPKDITNKQILEKYRSKWTRFWLDISHGMTKTMSKAARAADPDIKIISYTYFHNYAKSKKDLLREFKNIPKDPRREANLVDELMLSAYHTHGKKLVNMIRISKRYIKNADISIIEALARRTNLQSWVRKGDNLSPKQIYQNMILYAALGIKRVGLYPGNYIDGAFYKALGKASRLIWAHEDFYYQGKNIRKQIGISVTKNNKPASSKAFAYTAQQANGQRLVTLFNFTSEPLQFTVRMKDVSKAQRINVPAHGVNLKMFND